MGGFNSSGGAICWQFHGPYTLNRMAVKVQCFCMSALAAAQAVVVGQLRATWRPSRGLGFRVQGLRFRV